MKKPSWIVSNAEVVYRGNVHWVGPEKGDVDGGSHDCWLVDSKGKISDYGEGCNWVRWVDIMSAGSFKDFSAKAPKPPSKTERKKLAKDIRKAYDDLKVLIEDAEEKGLDVQCHLNTMDYNKCDEERYMEVGVSYQPATPPLEKL